MLASLRRISAIGASASLSPIVEFGLRFLRTVVLSRLLVPSQFGTCVAIGTLLATVKLASDLSLDKFVMIRGRGGAAALAAAHAVAILRGLLLAALLVVAAPAVAGFLDAPGATGSFRLVGLVLLIYSFANLQVQQMHLEYEYRPELIANLLSQGSAVAVLLPLFAIFGDHRIVIGSFLVEAGVYAVASHLLARLPFSVRADRRSIAAALRFGLPLTVNGIGLAAAAQFDRMIVGHWLGVVALAQYALIMTVGVVPISVLLRIMLALALPSLANRRNSPPAERGARVAIAWACALLGGGYALWVAASLDLLVASIFGSAYRVAPLVHALVTIIAAVKLVRIAPSVYLLAGGKTGGLAISTLSSGFGVAAALALVLLHPSLEAVLIGVLLGELSNLGLQVVFSWREAAGCHAAVLAATGGTLAVGSAAAMLIWRWPEDGWGTRAIILGLAASMWLAHAAIGYRHWRWSFPGKAQRA